MTLSSAIPLDERDRSAIEQAVGRLLSPSKVTLKLFGSRARGDYRCTSDIDLAIVANRRIAPAELAQLRDAFEESQIPFSIDLVDYASVPASLRLAIDREGIAWPVPISA